MAAPRIDVVISVYNGARTVEEALTSIRGQTIQDIRIIVVDDGSTDGTDAILRRIAEEDERVLVIFKPNSGIVDSVQMGLSHCTAPLIARHDADDRSYSDRFETQLRYLNENPDCVAVSGGARYIDSSGRHTGDVAFIVDLDAADADWIPAREPYLKQPFLMMRREALLAAGGYRQFRVAEDTDLCWRLRDVGRIHNMRCFFGDYRVHSSSISSASVHSGRIIALYSQLAALSARRRAAGTPDLQFDKAHVREYLNATSLSELHGIASDQLDAEEQRRLRIAMAAKLVEVSFYRKFKLERSDCAFIREAIHTGSDLMSPANRAILSRSVMETAIRIAGEGRISDGSRILRPSDRPRMLARLAFRNAMPAGLRSLVKRSLNRR